MSEFTEPPAQRSTTERFEIADADDSARQRPGAVRRPKGRSSLLVATSLVATSLLSALQAFALLVICGTDARTEAFLAALVLYLPVAVMGASLRATVSALVSRAPAAERAREASEIVSRCILFGAVVAGVMVLLTPVLGPVLSGDLPAEVRSTTITALAFLLPAAFLHIVAAALSGALGAREQFGFSAVTYVVTGSISLAASVATLFAIGPVGSGVGVLVGTVVLAGAHIHRGRAAGIRVRIAPRALLDRHQWRIAAEVLSGAALGFALQANLAISIAALGTQEGAITAYSYAFFLTAMFLSLSSLPLALVTLPDLVGEVQRAGRRAVADHLVRCAPFAYAVVLPLAFGFLAFGRPLATWMFEPFVAAQTAGLVFEVGQALALMTLPATLFYLASAASLPAATPLGRLLAAGFAIAVQVAALAFVSGAPQDVAWAHAAAMTVSTFALLLQVLGRHTLDTMLRTLRTVLPVVAAAAPILLVGLLVGSTARPIEAAVATLFAMAIYVTALLRLAPRVAAPFVALMRRVAPG